MERILAIILWIISWGLYGLSLIAIPLIIIISVIIIIMVGIKIVKNKKSVVAGEKKNNKIVTKGVVIAFVIWVSIILVKLLFPTDVLPPGGS